MKRSQSLSAVENRRKSLIRSQAPGTSDLERTGKRFSLSMIKNRSSSSFKNHRLSPQKNNKMQQFKQKILNYIEKRSDVEIINFYNQYKEEFFRKSINLQNLFYNQPETRQKYLNEQDMHFFKGFQHTLLTLFRKGTILPGEYKNMRVQTVQQIEKWVFSWIKRKKNYQQAIYDEEIATNETMNILAEISSWAQQMKQQKHIF